MDPDLDALGDPDATGFGVMRYGYPNLGDIVDFDTLRLTMRPQPAPFPLLLDEFRLGTGMATVLPTAEVIPEPGTLALLGLLVPRGRPSRTCLSAVIGFSGSPPN